MGLGYCKMLGGEQKAVPDCDWHLNPSSANAGIGGCSVIFWGGYRCVPAHVVPQETEEVCGHCLQLVAAVQLELGTDTTFAQTLMAHAERACEDLAPDLAREVKGTSTPWAPSSSSCMSPWHGRIFCSHLLSNSTQGAGVGGVQAGWW